MRVRVQVSVSVRCAREVLWFFEPWQEEAWEPGGFTEQLFKTFCKADMTNFSALAAGFPQYGRFMHMALHERDGLEEIKTFIKVSDGD